MRIFGKYLVSPWMSYLNIIAPSFLLVENLNQNCQRTQSWSVGELGFILIFIEFNPLQHFCLENPMNRGAWRLHSMGVQKVRHDWETNTNTCAAFTMLCSVWAIMCLMKILVFSLADKYIYIYIYMYSDVTSGDFTLSACWLRTDSSSSRSKQANPFQLPIFLY